MDHDGIMDGHQLVAAVTRAVREADVAFQVEGGTSRHWVRDHFLPQLRDQGLAIVPVLEREG